MYHRVMEKPKASRNPVWSRDELVLALALYVETGGNPTGSDFDAIDALSGLLNKMHRLAGAAGGATLRNRNGVYLKLMNFRSADPAYVRQGKVGMKRGNAMEAVLWKEYEGRLPALGADATAIRETIIEADEQFVAKLPPVEPYEGEEGGIVMQMHKRYEREPKLIREKRKAAAAQGKLICETCGFDFAATYGALGAGYIEVHHTKPVHTMIHHTKTNLNDLALLCANCHRMAHRKRVPLTLEEVRSALATT